MSKSIPISHICSFSWSKLEKEITQQKLHAFRSYSYSSLCWPLHIFLGPKISPVNTLALLGEHKNCRFSHNRKLTKKRFTKFLSQLKFYFLHLCWELVCANWVMTTNKVFLVDNRTNQNTSGDGEWANTLRSLLQVIIRANQNNSASCIDNYHTNLLTNRYRTFI